MRGKRGVHKKDGSRGWADVWLRGHFAWEYKKKHKDLIAARLLVEAVERGKAG